MSLINIPVRLSKVATVAVSVRYTTRAGTATEAQDFTPATGVVTFQPGETLKYVPIEVKDTAEIGRFFVDLTEPMNAPISKATSTVTLAQSLVPVVTEMLGNLFAYIQRATGSAATTAGMPPLVTTEGLVKNNQHTETVLGGYLPDGAASSEGISLMMRGVARAYAATGQDKYKTYFDFLFDAACEFFFFGSRPPITAIQWPHTWLVQAGNAFNVRGPIPANGALDQTGYVGIPVTFVNGVAQLVGTPPDQIFQVVTAPTEFVWPNVFADIVSGTGVALNLDVEYYINSEGNKVYGVQKGGSFGQPIEAGSSEPKGRIKLKGEYATFSGTLKVNYNVKVENKFISHGQPYEGWPMWRELMPAEASMAGDAIHWFADAFRIMRDAVPSNQEYKRALDGILRSWLRACNMESAAVQMFKAGSTGQYNDFPLTFAYAYGRENVDDPNSNWNGVPPTERFAVARTGDGYVTFTMPLMNGQTGSGMPIRYGVVFENEPLFLDFTIATKVLAFINASKPMLVTLDITTEAGKSYSAVVSVDSSIAVKEIPLPSFLEFQTTPIDSDGVATGEWPTGDGEEEADYTPPVYGSVAFPGRRVALIGDSITWMNSFWNPPVGTPGPWDTPGNGSGTPGGGWNPGGGSGGQAGSAATGYYEYFGHGMAGYFTYANQLMGQRLVLEPAMQDRQAMERLTGVPVGRYKNGNNFGIAGSRVTRWEEGQDDTLNDGVLEVGPVFNANRYRSKYDVVVIAGGTNDLAGAQTSAKTIFNRLIRYAYENASRGKWVFLCTIPPRTREWLGGWYSPAGGGWLNPDPSTIDPTAAYTIAKQDLVRQRLLEVNQMLRDWFANHSPPNMWLVDQYNDLVGPNGLDPFGHQSNDIDPLAKATHGNYKPGLEGKIACYDGLHPGPSGAYMWGRVLADRVIAAGVPPRGTGAAMPITNGPNLLGNPSFVCSRTRSNQSYGRSTKLGRARGLGRAKADATHLYWIYTAQYPTSTMPADYDYLSNLGLGYEHGDVPDYWFFYRSRNKFLNPGDKLDPPEGWSNFNEYTWSALATAYPILKQYMNDSTWADGCAKVSVIQHEGVPAYRIEFSTPQTGNKNESFIFRTLVPHGQHGVWDDYGYAEFDYNAWFQNHTVGPTQDEVNTVPNNLYSPGDYLYGEATVLMTNMVNLYTWRMALNFLAMDASAISEGDVRTTGAPISSYAHSQNFWPPNLITEVKLVPNPDPMVFRTTVVKAPAQRVLENQYYAQFEFNFAFDASEGPASGVIIIKAPGVYKITGGTLV